MKREKQWDKKRISMEVLKWGVKTIGTCRISELLKRVTTRKPVETIKNVCTNLVRLYIETWSQPLIKKTFHKQGSQTCWCMSFSL